MYDLLIPRVLEQFAPADMTERGFLEEVQQADVRLGAHFRTRGPVSPEIYTDPLIRAAYLLRYLGHYTLQLGDLLTALDGSPEVTAVLRRPHLRLIALCGGPCPEAIALSCLHHQLGGIDMDVTVLDRNASHCNDCWPIISAIASSYPEHPKVRIKGVGIDLFNEAIAPDERCALAEAQVVTTMNCLNELVGLGSERVRAGLRQRLSELKAGTLVLASDQAGYGDCTRGMNLLRELLQEHGAQILLDDQGQAHEVANRLMVPQRIAWMYGVANENRFRVHVKTLRMAALLG